MTDRNHGKRDSWITWRHLASDLKSCSFDKKVEIFREKLWGWYLYVAELCINSGEDLRYKGEQVRAIRDSGFGVLKLTFDYFELIARYYEGSINDAKCNDTAKKFQIGLKKVFPELDSESPEVVAFLSRLYQGVRCELYHNSRTAPGIILNGGNNPMFAFDSKQNCLRINPHRIPKALIHHLDQYCEELRTGTDAALKRNFEARFDYKFSK